MIHNLGLAYLKFQKYYAGNLDVTIINDNIAATTTIDITSKEFWGFVFDAAAIYHHYCGMIVKNEDGDCTPEEVDLYCARKINVEQIIGAMSNLHLQWNTPSSKLVVDGVNL